jgi:hypothetical protein
MESGAHAVVQIRDLANIGLTALRNSCAVNVVSRTVCAACFAVCLEKWIVCSGTLLA